MVPGHIEGIYGADAMTIALPPFCARAGVRFISADLLGLGGGIAHTTAGALPYDDLVLNLGAIAHRPGPLAHPRAIPAKPFPALMAGLSEAAGAKTFAVVGGGAAGVEVALALAASGRTVRLIERGNQILPTFPNRFRRLVARHLARRGVTVETGAAVEDVGATDLLLRGARVPADAVLAFTGAAPPPLVADLPLLRADDGFLAIDAGFQTSNPSVLAVGDVATNIPDPRPKAGVFAVRQGPLLAQTIEARVKGAPPPHHRIQRRGLVLLSTGARSAVGTRNGLTLEGRALWRLKDRLDRAFVTRFLP